MEAILTMPEERYLTISEVAARLRQSARTVRRRIQDGLLRAVEIPGRGKVGREYRVPESAVDEFIEQSRHKDEEQAE